MVALRSRRRLTKDIQSGEQGMWLRGGVLAGLVRARPFGSIPSTAKKKRRRKKKTQSRKQLRKMTGTAPNKRAPVCRLYMLASYCVGGRQVETGQSRRDHGLPSRLTCLPCLAPQLPIPESALPASRGTAPTPHLAQVFHRVRTIQGSPQNSECPNVGKLKPKLPSS